MCHFGTSILRLSSYIYIYIYIKAQGLYRICLVSSWTFHVTMSYPQGRRGIEGPEAMARGESTQGTAAAHAMFRAALFGCLGSSEEKQGETSLQSHNIHMSIQETSPFSKRLSPRVMCLMCLEFFFGNAGEVPTSVFLKALDSTVS